jgi:phospholipid/cholesterol/gamma-HCH transport system substrate-binding protein
MSRELREITIGAVAGLAGLLALMNLGQKSAPSAAETFITAKFNKVDGLNEGGEIRLGGIRIGTVTEMTLDSEYRAVVTMMLDSEIKLPTDTSAAIHTDGLFGSKFMVLEPGAEEDSLESGDEITFTQDALVVGDLMELIISEGKSAQAKLKAAAKAAN